MKSKRFREGISRMKIPDESNEAVDSVKLVEGKKCHKDWNSEKTDVYYPEKQYL